MRWASHYAPQHMLKQSGMCNHSLETCYDSCVLSKSQFAQCHVMWKHELWIPGGGIWRFWIQANARHDLCCSSTSTYWHCQPISHSKTSKFSFCSHLCLRRRSIGGFLEKQCQAHTTHAWSTSYSLHCDFTTKQGAGIVWIQYNIPNLPGLRIPMKLLRGHIKCQSSICWVSQWPFPTHIFATQAHASHLITQ